MEIKALHERQRAYYRSYAPYKTKLCERLLHLLLR